MDRDLFWGIVRGVAILFVVAFYSLLAWGLLVKALTEWIFSIR